jgi:hypothetical protein
MDPLASIICMTIFCWTISRISDDWVNAFYDLYEPDNEEE